MSKGWADRADSPEFVAHRASWLILSDVMAGEPRTDPTLKAARVAICRRNLENQFREDMLQVSGRLPEGRVQSDADLAYLAVVMRAWKGSPPDIEGVPQHDIPPGWATAVDRAVQQRLQDPAAAKVREFIGSERPLDLAVARQKIQQRWTVQDDVFAKISRGQLPGEADPLAHVHNAEAATLREQPWAVSGRSATPSSRPRLVVSLFGRSNKASAL